MVGGLGGRHEQEVRLFMLRHDHAARSGVLAGLRGGRRRRISLANDKFSREEFNWHNTVVLLANEGIAGPGPRAARLESAQPGFLRLSRRLVLARVCVPGAHARRNGGGPAAAAPVPGFVDHRHCLAGRQAAGGPAQARACDAAPFVRLRRRFRGRRRRRCRCCACWRRWARGSRSSPMRWRRRWLWAWGIRMPTQRAAVKALARLGREDLAHQQRDALAPAVAAMLSDAGAGSAAGGWRRAAKPRLVRRASRLAAARAAAPLDRRGRPGTLCRAAGSARRRAGVRAGAGLAGDVRAGGGHDRALAKRARYRPSATSSTTRRRCCWRRMIPRARSCRESSGKAPGAGRSMASGCGRMANPRRCPAPRKPPCCPVSSPGCARWRGSCRAGRRAVRCWPRPPTRRAGSMPMFCWPVTRRARESGAPFPVDLTQALRVPPEQRARVVEATGGAWPRSPTLCGSSGTAVGRKP